MQQQRFSRILAHLAAHEFLSGGEAARLLQASPATVRRDFRDLAAQGLVHRSRGGVRRAGPAVDGMSPFPLREVRFSKEKAALARHAAGLLRPSDVVMVDGGTTTYHLAASLPAFPLRVITNSLRLAAALSEHGWQRRALEVFLTGGYLYPQASILLGPQAVNALSQYHAHWCFLSAEGVSEAGLSNTNEMVVEVERVMMARAGKVVVLADHSKLGVRSMAHLCRLEDIDLLVTDAHPASAEFLAHARGVGIEVAEVRAEG
jgi:DeoR/GlpR family transcriptional regulator of sugar metabolism